MGDCDLLKILRELQSKANVTLKKVLHADFTEQTKADSSVRTVVLVQSRKIQAAVTKMGLEVG